MRELLGKKQIWLLLLYPISFGLLFIAKNNPQFSEYVFAQGAYRVISQIIAAISGSLRFSLIEVLLIFSVFAIIGVLIFFCVTLVRNKDKRLRLLSCGILNMLCFGAVLAIGFTVLCGINYYRYPFTYHSGLKIEPASKEDLYKLCVYLTETANTQRAQIPLEDDKGVTKLSGDFWQTGKSADDAFDKISKKYPVLGGHYPAPKPVIFSDFMSRTELTGVFSNFTMEANINTAATAFTIPATMCHELAHLRGFMREDEANFIAYLVCRQSDSIELRYSGTMLALIYAGNQLYAADYDLYKAMASGYSDGVRRDMSADYTYWKQFEKTAISKTSSKINDTYLKMNSQQDGVKSYGRMVDYLIADFKSASHYKYTELLTGIGAVFGTDCKNSPGRIPVSFLKTLQK